MVSPPDQQNTHNLVETTDKKGSRATELVPGALGAGDRTECAGTRCMNDNRPARVFVGQACCAASGLDAKASGQQRISL